MRFPLVGTRIELRLLESSDIAAAHRLYSDERVMRWVGTGPCTLKQTRAMVAEYIEHQDRHGFSFWAVIDRRSGELIGDAGLYTRGDEIELGYTIDANHWGRGYGTEAARLCVSAAFDELKAPALIALARPMNTASTAVLAKLGFKPEGELLAHGSPHTLYRLTPDAFKAADPA